MILIYSEFLSTRLDYVCDYIFRQRYKTPYRIICSKDDFLAEKDGFKINYSPDRSVDSDSHILPHPLLTQTNIVPQVLNIQRWKRTIIPFYNQPGSGIPFDLFSAVFYYLTRYEEYITDKKDKYGRFPVEESLSYRYKSLHQPVVDIWLMHLKKIINRNQRIITHEDKYEIHASIDIDLLYKYKHKNLIKKAGGLLKDMLAFRLKSIVERFMVYAGKRDDPFYYFGEINQVLKRSGHSLRYFLLTAHGTAFDQMHDLTKNLHRESVRSINRLFPVFLHPSFYSIEKGSLPDEKKLLESILGTPVQHSRQHYIKISWPQTYRTLIENGITDDHSMGYPQQNGFRAGTSRAFYWYDLENNRMEDLKIHPFSWMDATTLFYDRKRSLQELKLSWNMIHEEVVSTGGVMCPIFHNYIIGDRILYPAYHSLFLEIFKKQD